jgi:hypothetical protein
VFPTIPVRITRLVSALLVLSCAVMLVAPLSLASAASPGSEVIGGLIFYGVTAGAYGVLPFVEGRELSAPHMFADMAGVLMAAVPIYLARYRQIVQGDMRQHRRRDTDAAATSGPAAS